MTDGGAGEGKGGLISTQYGLASCLFSSVENEQQRREHNNYVYSFCLKNREEKQLKESLGQK